jgi:cyclophilin family peptidyl-prolyl cis-trans isomerase
MKYLLTCCLSLWLLQLSAKKPSHQYVRLTTSYGECIIMLYNETPLHRDNFIKLVKKGIYDRTLFHRVIKDFMIQGGDPDSKQATPGQQLGEGDVGYTIPAEFNDQLFHKKGVLAAAREDNPDKASSGCQFYLVQGKVFTDEQLDAVESKRLKFKIPAAQREVYKTMGGTPHLDRNYTVFGEMVQGLPLVDSIANVVTDPNNRPVTDVRMSLKLLKKREARKLEKMWNRK